MDLGMKLFNFTRLKATLVQAQPSSKGKKKRKRAEVRSHGGLQPNGPVTPPPHAPQPLISLTLSLIGPVLQPKSLSASRFLLFSWPAAHCNLFFPQPLSSTWASLWPNCASPRHQPSSFHILKCLFPSWPIVNLLKCY